MTNEVSNHNIPLGRKIAEAIAAFAGSWYFVSVLFLFVCMWIVGNRCLGCEVEPLDSYPLLNLILCCIGMIQGPIIMMGQKRAEQKDRARSKNDHQINLKAELEIRLLHDKMDQLIKIQTNSARTRELS